MSNQQPAPISPAESQIPPADDAALLALLVEWLPTQRWFPGARLGQRDLTLEHRTSVAATASTLIEWVVVAVPDPTCDTARDGSSDSDPAQQIDEPLVEYQILVGWRAESSETIEHAIIGVANGSICFDALHDHEVTALLLGVLTGDDVLGAISAVTEARCDAHAGGPGLVSTAEQSNTSVVFGDHIILKWYRRIEPGTNPDAELLRVLAPATPGEGAHHVPQLIGELVGLVRDEVTTLGVATEYFSNCADGWSMATASVRDLLGEADLHADEVGGDFAAESHRLGEAVAAVHRDLADRLGTVPLDDDAAGALVQSIALRAQRAISATPSLEPLASAIADTFRRLAETVTSRQSVLQRIHGDLHLGQVLRTLTGWVLIDFEGEPARSLATRRAMHSPLQDIAGMLRSFHYASHHMLLSSTSVSQREYRVTEWADRNRSAFCDGYAAAAGADPRDWAPLLAAFELEKAIYEVQYESRHRPLWETIPLAAVEDLTANH